MALSSSQGHLGHRLFPSGIALRHLPLCPTSHTFCWKDWRKYPPSYDTRVQVGHFLRYFSHRNPIKIENQYCRKWLISIIYNTMYINENNNRIRVNTKNWLCTKWFKIHSSSKYLTNSTNVLSLSYVLSIFSRCWEQSNEQNKYSWLWGN